MQDSHLSSLRMMIESLLKSDFFFGLFCHGSSGIGKTSIVSKVLTENKISFVTLSCYSTPLSFFNCLYKNNDKVILLDDCKGIIENRTVGISLIKAALSPTGHASVGNISDRKNTAKRILRWGSSTHKAIIREFEFTGRLIIISNTPPIGGQDGDAFKNRCLSYHIHLDREQRLRMLASAAKSKAEKDVYEFLKKNKSNISVDSLNYRTLLIGTSLLKTQKQEWKNLLLLTLPESQQHPVDLVRDLAESGIAIEQQYHRFHALTQRSRRSFFRYREECGLPKI